MCLFFFLNVYCSIILNFNHCFLIFIHIRLFELGFAPQLNEILSVLPSSRKTMLFSATLPQSLVEFARAGLQDPTLVRLDADSKLSPDLQSAFFSIKGSEKEGALLHIINNIIKIPTGETEASKQRAEALKTSTENKKRKRSDLLPINAKELPTETSTVVFTATKVFSSVLIFKYNT